MPYFSFARTTIDRPSGVSSASDASCAASASSASRDARQRGMNSVACRLPSVMVPVLSSSSVSTSPAASTARPDIASTLCCTSRSMPAMPIAEISAPIVVGIRQTSSAISTGIGIAGAGVAARTARASRRRAGRPASARPRRMFSADLVRRLRRSAPSTSAIMRSRNVWPGSRRDPHLDPVRDAPGAAGHPDRSAARFADDRRRLASDRRLVDRRRRLR